MSAANVEPSRAAGLRRLSTFASNAGSRYTKSRNFDFGPGRHGNVSMLSPYVRHRLVLEQELLEAALEQHSASAAEKFIQEVFWRTYFKGWLEHRPQVWKDYRKEVSRLIEALESDSSLAKRYRAAVDGATGIDCFDAWVSELRTTGYLHNHARMWFASIWVFTLGLPWQLGADFFYRHLVDGDPASNTLSWRWVCGLHTQGKTYLARASNIEKFTDGRFNPEGQLATIAPALVESQVYPVESIPVAESSTPRENVGLLITEEDCSPESLLDGRQPSAVLGALATSMRSQLPVGDKASDFARGAVADAVDRAVSSFGVEGSVSESADWSSLLLDWARQHTLSTVVTAYAPVGPVADALAAAKDTLNQNGVKLLQVRRSFDDAGWPHAQRGFFKLKKQIPALLDQLALRAA